MTPSFNLIREPWIPCLRPRGGPPEELSLSDTLARAHELSEVYDDSPLVTAALCRLLLAVLHRSLGLETRGEWRGIWQSGRFPMERIGGYLSAWEQRFDLFGAQHPFYQVAGMEADSCVPLSRLATEYASGNNATLFDHHADDAWASRGPAEAARLLVAAQSFALGFGRSGFVRIRGAPLQRPYLADGILLRGLTVWLSGQSLFETLALNLAPTPAADGDIPCWESDDPCSSIDHVTSGQRQAEPAHGFLDLYTWQSRLARLLPEVESGQVCVRRLYLTQGRSADKSPHDPMKPYQRSKTEGFTPLGLRPQRAAWRDSHALLAVQSADIRRPQVFDHIARAVADGWLPPESRYRMHVVGLATAPNKAGKFLLWRHDRLPLPAALLADADLMDALGGLLEGAEETGSLLRRRLSVVCRFFIAPDCDRPDGRKPKPEDVNALLRALDPETCYWARLEQHFYRLVEMLPCDEDAATEQWQSAVARQARDAFREACGRLGDSPRALRAVARVSDSFSPHLPNHRMKTEEVSA
jgi:CRISPR system Cascade subunit CasA